MASGGRFLFTVWPFPGHVFPHLAVAAALRELGHECVFYTGERARALIEPEGFAVEPFRALDEERLIGSMFAPTRGSLRVRDWRDLRRTLGGWLVDTLDGQLRDLDGVLARRRPDAIACDPAMWGPPLVLHEGRGLPVAILSYVIECPLPGPDAPPFGLGLRPPRDAWTRLLAAAARGGATLAGARIRRAANAVRARHGLAPIRGSVTEHLGTMPLYVVPSTPSFDYERRDLPPSVRYVGACSFNRPAAVVESPAWLADLPGDRPLVHATEGTVRVGEAVLLRATAAALADEPVDVVVTTGGERSDDALGGAPRADNVHVARFISHDELLPRVDAVVATGGAGAVAAALSHGVPLVCVPWEWDHAENARRVAEAGAGLRIPRRRLTPARLRAAVRRVLEEPSFRRNAERLGRDFRALGGPARAAELLQDLLPTTGREVASWRRDEQAAG